MERSIPQLAPAFEHLFRVEFDRGAPICIGSIPEGLMTVIPFPSGKFTGEKLRGEVLLGGGDWNTRRPDGVTCIDGKYILKTEDGSVISIEAKGSAVLPDQQARSTDGNSFRERLFFTAAGKYRWLNDVIAIGIGEVDRDGRVCLDAYAVS